jgi:adenosylcobinamide-GDP ribazoletransferase
VLLTGGIHLDGLCDTCDALGSHQSRERMLEIMKDPHIGAFGVMGCVLYLLALFAAWCQAGMGEKTLLLGALVPVASRSWVSLSVLTRPNARRGGLLAAFTSRARRRGSLAIGALWLLASNAALVLLGGAGGGMALAAAMVYGYVYLRTRASFGGLTGGLAGWELCLLELGQVFALAVLGGGA